MPSEKKIIPYFLSHMFYTSMSLLLKYLSRQKHLADDHLVWRTFPVIQKTKDALPSTH